MIVGIFFISPFLYCLLLNHSFQTNPNSVTNCFQLFLSVTTLQLHLLNAFAILIFETGMPILEYCIYYCEIKSKTEWNTWKKENIVAKRVNGRRKAITIELIDDSMLDASSIKHVR